MKGPSDRDHSDTSPSETVDADGLRHIYGKCSRRAVTDGAVEVLTVGGRTERIWQDPTERE